MRRLAIAFVLGLALAACSGKPEPRAGENTRTLTGKVVERLDSPPYSFLRLDTGQGEVWVAVPIASISGGDMVKLVNGVTLRNYDAKAIGKRFDPAPSKVGSPPVMPRCSGWSGMRSMMRRSSSVSPVPLVSRGECFQ